jgi:hypothetical protein
MWAAQYHSTKGFGRERNTRRVPRNRRPDRCVMKRTMTFIMVHSTDVSNPTPCHRNSETNGEPREDGNGTNANARTLNPTNDHDNDIMTTMRLQQHVDNDNNGNNNNGTPTLTQQHPTMDFHPHAPLPSGEGRFFLLSRGI